MEMKFKELEKDQYIPVSIVITDLNELKLINDTIGHRYGDEMLSTAAMIINSLKRESDEVVRYGGDEFVIISPNTSIEEAQKFVEAIQVKCMNTLIQGHPISIAVGFGIKSSVDQTLVEAFDQAEIWMYKAKKAAHIEK